MQILFKAIYAWIAPHMISSNKNQAHFAVTHACIASKYA
jgi:hypothetical protein